MHIFDIILVISGFASGLSMALLPSPHDRKASHSAIWALSFALGIYIVFLAVCANEANFWMAAAASVAAAGAGFASATFLKKESEMPSVAPVQTTKDAHA